MCISRSEMTEKYYDMVYRLALSRTKSRTHAEDVSQEVFLRFLKTDKVFESEEHIRAWLLRVCINLSKNIVSSFWNRNRRSWEDFAETLCFTEETDKRLFETVMGLPEKYRIVIHLFYYEGYSVQEISKLLHRREGTVKSHLSRGRKILKLELQEDWSDDE